MPNFKKDTKGFKMKGFSQFNMGKSYGKTPMKKDEPLMAKLKRLRKEGKNKEADKIQKIIDKGYSTAGYDKE